MGRLLRLGLRATIALVAFALQTVHPNPGPRRRDKTEEGKTRRKERRKERRRERRRIGAEQRQPVTNSIPDPNPEGKDRVTAVTWNVQGMSVRVSGRRKLREVAQFMRKEKWDVVLLSEVRAP